MLTIPFVKTARKTAKQSLCAVAILLVAIGASATSFNPNTVVWQLDGSVQCYGGNVKTPAELKEELESAGITVREVAAGQSTNAFMTVCGAPTGAAIAAVIPIWHVDQAKTMGLKTLSMSPGFTPEAAFQFRIHTEFNGQ